MKKSEFTILLIDDSITFTKIVSEIITKNIPNSDVKAVQSGMEAIRVLGNNKIDLILMDVFMPVYNGFEMAKIIRNNEKTNKVPIIFITGADPNNDMMQQAIELGGVDYINKSFKEEDLIRLVNLYLRFVGWERDVNQKLDNTIILLNQEIAIRKEIEKSLMEITGKLKTANLTKDKFFSIIAHDLKNPLGAFKNLADVMRSSFYEMGKDEVAEFLDALSESANNMYSLLENLLTWSRTQVGAVKANFDIFNIKDLLDNVVAMLRNNALEKKITVSIECEPEVHVFADVNMIQSVVRNILTNAIKFTAFGGSIRLAVIPNSDDVTIRIIDSGVGMNNDDLQNLFILGSGNSKLGTNMETGTGLGLMICKEFIHLHNSEIKVKSQEGLGSEFSFNLAKPQ